MCRVDISPVGRCRGSLHRKKLFAKFLTIWVPTQLHISVRPIIEGTHSLPCNGRLAAAFWESRGWVLQEADGTGPLALGEGPDLSLLLMSYRRGSRARVLSHPSPIGPAAKEPFRGSGMQQIGVNLAGVHGTLYSRAKGRLRIGWSGDGRNVTTTGRESFTPLASSRSPMTWQAWVHSERRRRG